MHVAGDDDDSGKHKDVGSPSLSSSATLIATASSKPPLGRTTTLPKSFFPDAVASVGTHALDSMRVGTLSVLTFEGEPMRMMMWLPGTTSVPVMVVHGTSVDSWITISVASKQLASGAVAQTHAPAMTTR